MREENDEKQQQIDSFIEGLKSLIITNDLRQHNISQLYEKHPEVNVSIRRLLMVAERQLFKKSRENRLHEEQFESKSYDLEIKLLWFLRIFSHPIIGFVATIIEISIAAYTNWTVPSVFNTMLAFITFLMQLSIYPHIKKAFKELE